MGGAVGAIGNMVAGGVAQAQGKLQGMNPMKDVMQTPGMFQVREVRCEEAWTELIEQLTSEDNKISIIWMVLYIIGTIVSLGGAAPILVWVIMKKGKALKLKEYLQGHLDKIKDPSANLFDLKGQFSGM